MLLIKGADWLVAGGTGIAQLFKLSDLVIGLTIVSFGTSAPELIVNIIASFNGSSEIAIGNIVGSNIANTLLILGATAAVAPLLVKKSTVFKEIPFALLACVLLLVFANDALVDGSGINSISRSDGVAFLGFFVIFMYYVFGISKDTKHEHVSKTSTPAWLSTILIIVGSIGLAAGGELVVRGASTIALQFGVTESLIGLTIVAVGTSLPELTASLIAAVKNKPDMSVGNIIGSNIFNVFWILGLSALIKPLPYATAINADLLFILAATILLLLFIDTGTLKHRIMFFARRKREHKITRTEGHILLFLYFAYIVYVVARG